MRKALLRAARVRTVSGRQCPEVDRAALWGPGIFQELQETIAAALRSSGRFSMVGSTYRSACRNEAFIIISRQETYVKADHRLW